jgi:hypothetical protein
VDLCPGRRTILTLFRVGVCAVMHTRVAPLLCDWGQFGDAGAHYADGVMPIDRADTDERLARIERMIDEYRADQRHQLLRQMTKFRRLAEARRTHAAVKVPPRAH